MVKIMEILLLMNKMMNNIYKANKLNKLKNKNQNIMEFNFLVVVSLILYQNNKIIKKVTQIQK